MTQNQANLVPSYIHTTPSTYFLEATSQKSCITAHPAKMHVTTMNTQEIKNKKQKRIEK